MSDSKTIVKNALFLYMRMFLILGVSLYTSRVVLQQLGVSDYGIYSLVGGIVAMLGFFNAAMSSATQRYLSFDIGKNDVVKLKKTFSITLTIHLLIAILALVFAETIGLWYINYQMVFPENRLFSVNVVYQFTVLTFLLNIIQVPYNALVIARERMSVYAYVSILEAILKLTIVFLLVIGEDKLIWYSILTFIVAFIIRIIYQIYCRKKFEESRYRFEYDKKYMIELLSYSGWNLFGNFASVARGQGVNIILNLFFGTVVNAAYGISVQVQSAVQMFVNNFQIAVNPSLIKSYAQNNLNKSIRLMVQASKFSFFLSLILILPIILEVERIVSFWLGNSVPKHALMFIQLCLVSVLIDSISGPLMTMVQATGKIRNYQIVVGTLVFLNLPLAYLGLRILENPNFVFYVLIFISIISLIARIYFVNKILELKFSFFLCEVIKPIIIVVSFVILVILLLKKYLFSTELNDYKFIFSIIYYLVVIIFGVLVFGITKNEKTQLLALMKTKIIKKK